MTHKEQLSSPLYRYWVKAGLGFKYLKCGLERFVDNEVKELQVSFLHDICKTNGLKEVKCTKCTTTNTIPCPTYGICNVRKGGGICTFHERSNTAKAAKPCPNSICNTIHQKIKDQHRYKNPSWKNTDACQWCTNHWQIAKCYLPLGGYEDKTSAMETDCSGLLSVINNCLFLENGLDVFLHPPNDIVSKETRMDAMTNTEDEHRQQIEYSRRKQELQSKLCSIYEQHLSTIPVSPVLSEIEASIDDVFVELVICDDLIHEPKTLEKRINTGRQVKDYRDVIYKNGEKCKNIYVIGEAGMGKTTWCMNLLSTCVRAFKKNTGQMTSTNEPMTTDERTISDFDVVLFASLRHATSDGNIRDMIDHQLYLEHPELVDITTECIEKEPHKCLIVLDGLDEWSPPNKFIPSSILQHPGLPCRKDLHDCTVLTTTRPWKMDMVRLKDNDIDRAVKIQGIKDPHTLAEKIINSLHRKCFKEMDKTAKNKDVVNFENHVREVFHMDTPDLSHVEHSVWENMPSFMEVPLILVFMICVWFQKNTLEKTLAANYSELLAFLITSAEGDTISGKLGRLSDKTNLQILKDKWSVSAGSLPDCIKRMDNCKGYSGLLLRLSILAFDALFDLDGKENSLVFTAVELKSKLTNEELEVALKIGILSQSKAVGNVLSRESSLSFLHKTIQEYLAAMHLVCSMQNGNCEAVEKYKHYCSSSWMRITEMENILTFVCGMNPHIASKMSEHVARVAEDRNVTDEIESLTLKCVQEVSAAHGMAYPSSLYPIQAYRVNIILSVDDTFKHQFVLLKTNKGRIKYLSIMVNFEVDEATTSIEAYVNGISFEDEEDDVPGNKLKLTVKDKIKHLTKILEELQQPQCNQCLVTLSWIGMPFSSIPMHVLPNALSQMSQLRRLELSEIRQTASSSTVMDVDLTNCHSLAQFRCSYMSHFTFTLQQNKLELLYLCDLRSCNVNINPTNNPLSSGETAFSICKGAEITCTGLTICKIYLVTTCRVIEHVKFDDCNECEFVICTDNTEHVQRSHQDPLISSGTILKEITCTEIKNSKITLTTTCRDIGYVFIGNCNECEIVIDTDNIETVEESTEYIGTIIKQISCTETKKCKITLATLCWAIDHVEIDDCASFEFVIDTGNTKSVQGSIRDHVSNIRTTIKEISFTKTNNSKITLTTSCTEIDTVYIDQCNACEFVTDTGNTKLVQGSTRDHAINIRTTIKQISCTKTKNSKFTLTASCTEIDTVYIDQCDACEFVIQHGNTEQVQGSNHDHVDIRTAIKEIKCTQIKNVKISLPAKCTEIDRVNIDECDACEFVKDTGNTKLVQGSTRDDAINIRTTIKQISFTKTKNSKMTLTASCTEIDTVYIDQSDACEFVIQHGNNEQVQGSIKDHFDIRTAIKEIKCTQIKNVKISLPAKCTEIDRVNIGKCDACEFVIDTGNTKLIQGSIRDHVINIRSTIKQITCTKTKNSKITLTTSCTEIDTVYIDQCDACEFVIQCGNTEQVQRSVQDHVDIRTTIKQINCTQTKNSKISLTATCTEIDLVNIDKCYACEFFIQLGNTEQVQGSVQDHVDIRTPIKQINCTQTTNGKITLTAICTDINNVDFRKYKSCKFIINPGYSKTNQRYTHDNDINIGTIQFISATSCILDMCAIVKRKAMYHRTCSFRFQWQYIQQLFIQRNGVLSCLRQSGDCDNLFNHVLKVCKQNDLPRDSFKTRRLLLEDSDWQPLGNVHHSLTQLEILELEDDRNLYSSAIMSLKHLTHLRQLVCRYLPIDSWEALGNILHSMKQLKILNLEGSHHRHVPSSVVQALKRLFNLTHLECRCFSDAAWDALGKILPCMHQLTILYLKGSDQTDVPSSVIVNLKHCVNLTHLACIQLSGVVWEELGKCLSSMPQLEILNVEGSDGSRVPLSVIRCIEQLTHIKHLACAYLDYASWEDLDIILPSLTQIEILKMGVSSRGASSMGHSLSCLTNLKNLTLDLEQCCKHGKINTDTLSASPNASLDDRLGEIEEFKREIEFKYFIANLPNHILEVELHNVKSDTVNLIKSLSRFPSQLWERQGLSEVYSATLKSTGSGT